MATKGVRKDEASAAASGVGGRGLAIVREWFARRGWEPFAFQERAWEAYRRGESGLVHAPTGMGKSLSVWLGPVSQWLDEHGAPEAGPPDLSGRGRDKAEPLRVLWITPMRALATDTARALELPVQELGMPWTIEKRTGDTAGSLKVKQRERLPTCLVTTPESLSLLISYPGGRERFASLRCIVVDEWHELLSSKRGTQTELALARLRRWCPGVRTWGLSATLGNLDQALAVLTGAPDDAKQSPGVLISGDLKKEMFIHTVLPESSERFPWAGHLGLRLLDKVLREIEKVGTSLLFTNTRSQAELWFRALMQARPEWMGRIAIHHGSLDREVRGEVEELLRRGELLCVVCTSSLDLGVDFSPVEQVIQVGSPKGVARLLQRAGRSGHQPGAVSTVVCVPTNAMELLEFAAARDAMLAREVEAREPLEKPLDVLVQHLVTVALGEAFEEGELYEEVRSSWAYRNLSPQEWRWCMDFVTTGGPTLRAYPQYARLVPAAAADGPSGFRPASLSVERAHRLGIGTINSDAAVKVAFSNGRTLGTIEEGFIAKLKIGDRFVFAGKVLQLVRVHQMTAHVEVSKRGGAVVTRWDGGRTPLSTQLAGAVRRRLEAAREGRGMDCPEMVAAGPLLSLQAEWSMIPGPDELLIEHLQSRDGYHVFLFPFEGRLVHEGLGALLAHRLAALGPRSVSVTANDAGIELLSPTELPSDAASWRVLLSEERLLEDLLSCLNSTELTRRQFRDIARVAGLLAPSFPGQGKTARQLQASSELFFDVFLEFDPANQLLEQARREVLEQQLELGRLARTLTRLAGLQIRLRSPGRLTPFSFALWAEGIRTQQVTSETWSDRVQRMVVLLEKEADGGGGGSRDEDGGANVPARAARGKRPGPRGRGTGRGGGAGA